MKLTMESLFKKANLYPYSSLEVNKYYDVTDKNFYTYSRNDKTGEIEKKRIKSLVYKGEHPVYKVVNKSGEILLKGSPYHCLFDVNKQEYFGLAEQNEFKILLQTGETMDVFIEKTEETSPILDLEVEDNHNYFTNTILSHNTGGQSVPFYATTRNRVTRLENIEDKGKVIGIRMRVRNYKNKGGVPFRDAEMEFYFDKGFNSNNEYADFLIEFGIFKQGGAWLSSEKYNVKLNGKAKLLEWLNEHPAEYEEMKTFVDQKLLGFCQELDGDNIDPMKTDDGAMERTRAFDESTVADVNIDDLAKSVLDE